MSVQHRAAFPVCGREPTFDLISASINPGLAWDLLQAGPLGQLPLISMSGRMAKVCPQLAACASTPANQITNPLPANPNTSARANHKPCALIRPPALLQQTTIPAKQRGYPLVSFTRYRTSLTQTLNPKWPHAFNGGFSPVSADKNLKILSGNI